MDRLRLPLLQPPSPGASGEAWRAWQGWEGLGEEGARMHHEDEHDRLEKQLELRGGRADGRIELACESLFSSGADANGKPSEADGAAPARRRTSKAAANGTRSPLSSQRRRPHAHAPQPIRWLEHAYTA